MAMKDMASDKSELAGRVGLGRILLVEDNLIIAMNTEALLEELGAEKVEVATSVATAMELIAAQQFDLAILDLNLGNETSVPVAERLRTDQVPVIFSTGYGDNAPLPDDLAKAPVLKKPYTFADLEHMLRGR